MTDESAKLLADAINRLAAAVEGANMRVTNAGYNGSNAPRRYYTGLPHQGGNGEPRLFAGGYGS